MTEAMLSIACAHWLVSALYAFEAIEGGEAREGLAALVWFASGALWMWVAMTGHATWGGQV